MKRETRSDSMVRAIRILALGALAAMLLPAPSAKAAVVPTAGLTRIAFQPRAAKLSGRGVSQRFMIFGYYADGRVRDVTSLAKVVKTGPGGVTLRGNRLTSTLDGALKLTATVAGRTAAMSVTVQDANTPQEWSFANEIVPIFTKAGCNTGGCHGSPSGRGSFRLSLFGYEPDYDYDQIIKERNGRRVVMTNPEKSLILQKPTMGVPHGGGMRFKAGSEFYNRILDWLRAKAPKQGEFDARLAKIEVFPKEWTLDRPGAAQPMLVLAVRDDGTTQDVTHYARFTSNDDQVAEVDEEGLITAKQQGETSVMVRYLGGVGITRVRIPRDPLPAAAFDNFKPVNYIDELVLQKLKEVRIPASDPASDAEFLRRASIDTCGVTPSPEEARAFLDDRDPNKRQKLVEGLFARPEFVDYWTLKWSDLFRNNQQTKQDKGLQVFYRWIRDSVRDNKPWDQMVREMVMASGSGFRYGPANWYNIEAVGEEYPLFMASATSQAFLGVRMDCARCHNHPFEAWSQMDYYALAAFFARTRVKGGPDQNEKIFYSAPDGEVFHPRRDRARPDAVVPAKLLGGDVVTFASEEDRRERLAAWLTAPENYWFKRSIANRLWNSFFGRGIVNPVDDYRLTNPPSNDRLLDGLADRLVTYKFDLRKLMRDILLSRTYQTTSKPNKLNANDRLYASHALPRRLFAEVLLDAITTATEVPEKLGVYEYGRRAISIPDNRVPNGFLDLFGRPKRETACECERTEDTNVTMVLNLLNGDTINGRITNPNGRVARAVQAKKPPKEIVEEFYLVTVARRPNPQEEAAALKLIASAPNLQSGAEDLMWGLLNTREFLFNH
jgi:hypothetical protein